MHITIEDLNKVQDALMSRDPTQCLIAQGIIAQTKDSEAPADIRAKAEALYADDELEIDDHVSESRADYGSWVQAWVWVPLPEVEDDDAAHWPCPYCDGATEHATGCEMLAMA